MSTQTIMYVSEIESEIEAAIDSSIPTHNTTPTPDYSSELEYPSELESSKVEPNISFDTFSINKRDESFMEATLAYLRLLYYQYEVTFTLYMLTPGEKIILNTIVICFLSLVGYGVFLMLPQFVFRAAGYLFWDCIGKKEHAVRQVFRLNTTGSSWNAIHPALVQ